MLDSGLVQIKLDYSHPTNNYSGAGGGEYIWSDDIIVGTHVWRVLCAPRGYGDDARGKYVSIFLTLTGNNKSKPVKTMFHVVMVGGHDDVDGRPVAALPPFERRLLKVFPHKNLRTCGWRKFMKLSILESLVVARGRPVTFLCSVIVVDDDVSDLSRDLGRLLLDDDGTTTTADVTFAVDGETVPAHRAVLAARSPVFKAELFGAMAEAKMSCIPVQDITPATLRTMLRFMYTDVFPEDDELVGVDSSPRETVLQDLLAAADRYALDRLKLICAQKLWEDVSADTVAATLACAETYSCFELKSRCLDFFAVEENFKKAVLTEGFVQLVQKFPSIIVELRERLGI